MSQKLRVHNEIAAGCSACRAGNGLGFELTMAFQPIVNTETRTVFAYEALVRGVDGLSAAQILSLVNDDNRYAFDQTCRVKAIELAAKLDLTRDGAKLSVNFMPGAVYSPAACIRRTLQAATFHRFPLEAIIFEITEGERVADTGHMQRIATEYMKHGFTLALDDFGAGFSGLNLLSELDGIQLIKLDGALIRNIHTNPRAQQIVASLVQLCRQLGIEILAECVETREEYEVIRNAGITLMQGYLFAKPGYESLPAVSWPDAKFEPQAAISEQPALVLAANAA